MSNRINNSYGSGSVYNSETKKDRASTGKSFGELYVGDHDDEEDQVEAQADSSNSAEEDLGGLSDDLGSIFGSYGSSGSSNYDRDNQSSTSSSSRNTRTNSSQHTEKHQNKPVNKAQHKEKPEIEKSSQFDEQEEPKKFKDLLKNDQLPAFQVPMQVERSFMPTAIQPTSKTLPPQMVEQIVQDVRLGINEHGLAEFQFDLKSDVLDGLKLKISTKDGQVYATFIAENVHVKDTIDQSAQELVKALQNKGLDVANIQVSIASDNSGSNSNGGGQGGFGQSDQGQSNQQNQGYNGYSYADESSGSNSIDTNKSNTDYTV